MKKKKTFDKKETFVFNRAFRWSFKPEGNGNISHFVKSVRVDMVNKTLIVKAYSVASSEAIVEEWVNSLVNKLGQLTIEHYDACGKVITRDVFSGSKAVLHEAVWDYADSTDTIIQKIEFTYKTWQNEV